MDLMLQKNNPELVRLWATLFCYGHLFHYLWQNSWFVPHFEEI